MSSASRWEHNELAGSLLHGGGEELRRVPSSNLQQRYKSSDNLRSGSGLKSGGNSSGSLVHQQGQVAREGLGGAVEAASSGAGTVRCTHLYTLSSRPYAR